MEYQFSHKVVYSTTDAVPVSDVIDSLIGTERAVRELGPLLEACIKGLSVEKVELGVQEISQESPLRELFVVTLVVTMQEQLSEEVPALLEKIFGVEVPDQYDTAVTVCILILLFYGVDYVYRKFHDVPQSKRIGRQLDGLIVDAATKLGCSEDHIRSVLEQKYGGSKIKGLARSAMQFFRPSKGQSNAPIIAGKQNIRRQTIAEIPSDVTDDILSPDSTSDFLKDVELEIHAQDVDRPQQGWAAVIPGHVEKRVKMMLFPPVQPEDVYTKERVRGDVAVVFSRQDDGELRPTMIHLLRIAD